MVMPQTPQEEPFGAELSLWKLSCYLCDQLGPYYQSPRGFFCKYLVTRLQPWLVWLSGLTASLQTQRSPVQLPARAHAWVVGQVPSWGHARGN